MRQSGGKPSNRYSRLEHQWTFNIPAGESAMLTVNAWHNDNSENDHFNFEYSTNGSSWTPMFTVNNSDTEANYYWPLTGVSGTAYVRVMDTDANGNSFQDTGLNASTTYDYRVFAFNFAGDSSAPTNTATAVTDDPPPTPNVELFVVANKSKGKDAPQLSWNPAASLMDVYFNGSGTPLATGVASGWVHETGNRCQ